MRRDPHRQAWTDFFEGNQVRRGPKYGNERTGKYASKKEEGIARDLAALERSGNIWHLYEQVPFILVPADGKLRAVKYIADFVYSDRHGQHVVDVKGGEATKTQVYRLKRRLMKHIHGITIEEV